jgi:GNAT superfamily N-acetyltransferase
MNNRPVASTERLDIYSHTITRSEANGGCSRTVFHAWFHSGDVPRPVCVATVHFSPLGNFTEWVHVEEKYRRQGIATETLRAIEQILGELDLSGATPAGEAFCEAFIKGGA